MIFRETFKKQGWVISILLAFFVFGACSKAEDDVLPPKMPEEKTPQSPEEDDDPITVQSDTLEIKIGYNLNVSEEELVTTRSEFGSCDLIGVQIYHLTTQSLEWRISYACGVFDDLENLVFKFVKGNRYLIQMTYYPNAKDIVYNYPDGTYGAPFSYLYGLKSYKLNEPVYYSGKGNDNWSGNIGAELTYLMGNTYQPTDDRYVQSFKRGMTPRYTGEIEEITIEDGTQIIMPLHLCMMGITLNADNFTEGILTMTFNTYNSDWIVTPNDNHSIQFQIPYNYLANGYEGYHYYDLSDSGENIQLFYTSASGEKYLLATKLLSWKMGVNYVFNFSLTEREDGSIGIQMPSDETFQDEESFFD